MNWLCLQQVCLVPPHPLQHSFSDKGKSTSSHRKHTGMKFRKGTGNARRTPRAAAGPLWFRALYVTCGSRLCMFGHERGSLIAKEQSPLCVPEDEEHILWRCPRWEALRREKQAPNDWDRSAWPPCTSRCGFSLEDPESVAWADMGPSTRALSTSCNIFPDSVLSDERFERETNNNDRVVAWTDGASGCNQDARFRRAGCGGFFGINDDRNCSFTLPGREQKNNRAELLAVIEIRSDSEYVVRIATSRTRGETQKCNEGNADLWDVFETQLRLTATRRFDFVRGHATKLHIDRQITTSLNNRGNDAADSWASAAAAHHAAPQALTEAAIGRQRTAMVTHSFASGLLFRRRVALLALREADHGGTPHRLRKVFTLSRFDDWCCRTSWFSALRSAAS